MRMIKGVGRVERIQVPRRRRRFFFGKVHLRHRVISELFYAALFSKNYLSGWSVEVRLW